MKFNVKKIQVIQNSIENRANSMKVLSIESDNENDMFITVYDTFLKRERKARILKRRLGYRGAFMLEQKSEYSSNLIYVHYVTL